MTKIEMVKEVLDNVRWSEARDGIVWAVRYEAAKKIIGLLNGHGDKRLVGAAFRAMNFAKGAM